MKNLKHRPISVTVRKHGKDILLKMHLEPGEEPRYFSGELLKRLLTNPDIQKMFGPTVSPDGTVHFMVPGRRDSKGEVYTVHARPGD